MIIEKDVFVFIVRQSKINLGCFNGFEDFGDLFG